MKLIQGTSPCGKYRPLLDSYLSNELLVETTHDVMRHLDGCASCRFELDERMRVRAGLRKAVGSVAAPPELRGRILTALEAPGRAAGMPGPSGKAGWMQVAAGVAVLLFSGLLFEVLVRNPGQFEALLDLAWHQHEGCTVAGHYPAEPPTEAKMRHDLGAHYEALLPVMQTELSDYRIRKAHICRPGGREYAHFILQKGDALVSVSLLKKQDGEALGRPVAPSARQGGQLTAFETGTHVAFVMGNVGAAEAERVAIVIRPGVLAAGL
ncbi:MAG: zf-HC2 domain-containing protein [Bryobacterales bacterium]|nr:zf-HC2 domain-containing protein [Bryobacterales bacterium]